MKRIELAEAAAVELSNARTSTTGRSFTNLGMQEQQLRQCVVGLLRGQTLEFPADGSEATLQVISGHARLTNGTAHSEGVSGTLWATPTGGFSVRAVEDLVLLLTVARGKPAITPADGPVHFIDRPIDSWHEPDNW